MRRNEMIGGRKAKKVLWCGLAAVAMIALLPFFARADNYGDQAAFNIDKQYDSAGRSQLSASLVWAGEKIYFYADNAWWNDLDPLERQRLAPFFRVWTRNFHDTSSPSSRSFLAPAPVPAPPATANSRF